MNGTFRLEYAGDEGNKVYVLTNPISIKCENHIIDIELSSSDGPENPFTTDVISDQILDVFTTRRNDV